MCIFRTQCVKLEQWDWAVAPLVEHLPGRQGLCSSGPTGLEPSHLGSARQEGQPCLRKLEERLGYLRLSQLTK